MKTKKRVITAGILVLMLSFTGCSSKSSIQGAPVPIVDFDTNTVKDSEVLTQETTDEGEVLLHFSNKVKDVDEAYVVLEDNSYRANIKKGVLRYTGTPPTKEKPLIMIEQQTSKTEKIGLKGKEGETEGYYKIDIPFSEDIRGMKVDTLEEDGSLQADFDYVPAKNGKEKDKFVINLYDVPETVEEVLVTVTKTANDLPIE